MIYTILGIAALFLLSIIVVFFTIACVLFFIVCIMGLVGMIKSEWRKLRDE